MSNASTIRYSSAAGVDWAALIAGLGLGLTVAMQVTTMTYSDISSPYALMVAGKDGAKWFGLPELASYSAWVVNRNENTAWSVND